MEATTGGERWRVVRTRARNVGFEVTYEMARSERPYRLFLFGGESDEELVVAFAVYHFVLFSFVSFFGVVLFCAFLFARVCNKSLGVMLSILHSSG